MSYEPTIWKKGDKVTSTKLNKIENGIQGNDEEITSIKEGLSTIQTATAEDVGKALKAKTVTDGKVTEWEFGEAGGSPIVNTNAEDVDLDIVDDLGNVVLRLAGGHVKTKNFDSSDIESRVSVIETLKWSEKKWTCIGDSLTEANERASKRYYDYVAEKTGITVVNKGISGTGYMSGVTSNRSFITRVDTVPTDSDVVTIFGSCNDRMLTLGDVTDTGTTTVCGCINTTLDSLLARMPTCNLGIITPTPIKGNGANNPNSSMSLYANAIVEICRRRSIPCLDLFHCSGLHPDDATAEALTFSKDDGNGVHPDENGHAIIAPRFEAFLEMLL